MWGTACALPGYGVLRWGSSTRSSKGWIWSQLKVRTCWWPGCDRSGPTGAGAGGAGAARRTMTRVRDDGRWRGLDAGTTRVYLEADAPQVACPEHGVVVAAVPWARHGSRFTTAFEDTAVWLACHAAVTVLAMLLRITWRSVSAIVVRVVAEAAGTRDWLAGLRRIGIDEISYRKGQRYLLCVVDHDTGRLVWAGKNRTAATLREFFDLLGQTRSAQLTHVSADGAKWIHDVVAERAPQAVLCLDAFHVVAETTAALDAVRRRAWNQLRRRGDKTTASEMKNSRWALLKNPDALSGDQKTTLAVIAKINRPLYRAYLLKEQLREIFQTKGTHGKGC